MPTRIDPVANAGRSTVAPILRPLGYKVRGRLYILERPECQLVVWLQGLHGDAQRRFTLEGGIRSNALARIELASGRVPSDWFSAPSITVCHLRRRIGQVEQQRSDIWVAPDSDGNLPPEQAALLERLSIRLSDFLLRTGTDVGLRDWWLERALNERGLQDLELLYLLMLLSEIGPVETVPEIRTRLLSRVAGSPFETRVRQDLTRLNML